MLRGQCLRRLQFDNKLVLDKQIREIVAKNRSILIIDCDRILVLDAETGFAQSMGQRVFIDLLP